MGEYATQESEWKARALTAEAECGRLREHAKEQELLAETRKESRRMYRERAEAAEQLAGRLREQLDAERLTHARIELQAVARVTALTEQLDAARQAQRDALLLLGQASGSESLSRAKAVLRAALGIGDD